MPVTNGKITAPISMSDARDALFESSLDLGTLCKSEKINRWSLHKPVIHTALGDNVADVHRAADGKCGFVFTEYGALGSLNTAGSFLYDRMNDACEWTRALPYGGSASPFRLTDFNGYNHNAECFLDFSGFPDTLFYDANGDVTLYVEDDVAESDWVKESDISISGANGIRLSQMYFGVVLRKGNNYLVFTAPLGSHDIELSGFNSSLAGIYTAGFFYSTAPDPINDSCTLVCAPVACKSINIVSAGAIVEIVVYATWTSEESGDDIYPTRNLSFYYTVENTSASALTINNISMTLVRSTTELENGEGVATFVSGVTQTIGANSMWTSPTYNKVAEGYSSDYIYGILANATGVDASYWEIEE